MEDRGASTPPVAGLTLRDPARRSAPKAVEVDASEERIRLIAERISDVIIRADMTGRVIYVSPSVRALGYEPHELLGQNGAMYIHPDDGAHFLENGRLLIREGKVTAPRDRQHRFRRKDGTYIWLEGNPTVLTDDNGVPYELINVFRDVTERRAHEDRLAAKEAELQRIMALTPDMLLRLSPEDLILYASPASERFGYRPEELIGRTRAELVHPEDYPALQAQAAEYAANAALTPQDLRYRLRRADGSYAWVESCPTYVRDADGRMLEVVTAVRDISARREIEAALAQSEARYRLLAERMSDIILRFGPDGLIRYISPGCRRLGMDPDASVGSSVLDLIAPERRAESQAVIDALFQDRMPEPPPQSEHLVRTSDGREIWLEGSPTLIRDDAGRVVEVISTLRDVTTRRQAETSLAESERRFRRLAENARDIISRCDTRGRVTYISPAFELITGFAAEDLIGRQADVNILDEDKPAARAAFFAAVNGGADAQAQPVQYRSRCKDGRIVWLESCPTPDVDVATGKVIGVTDIVRDVTQRVALQEDLRRARAEAEAAAQAKADLLATMSHELRTPLTSVIGFGRLLSEQPELSQASRNFIGRMSEASRALLSAVNDILDFSKLEAGKVTIAPRPTEVAELARGALEMFQPQAGAKDISLDLNLQIDPHLALMIDPDRTRQVLLNLIGNAVKFTDDGGVALHIRYDDAENLLDIRVCDTGPGIPEDRLDRLFLRYSEVDGSLARSHGGTGLGLAICRGLVESQGGEIGAFNRPEGGSCFYFRIPAARTASIGEAPHSAHGLPFEGVRVLVADDHPANRELASLFLGGVGAEIAFARDGEEAVELAMAQPFDAILMDLRMPKLDGPGALRRLRSGEGPNDATPVLAFTAESGDPDILAHLQAAGFQGLVSKPLEAADLIAAIAEAVG